MIEALAQRAEERGRDHLELRNGGLCPGVHRSDLLDGCGGGHDSNLGAVDSLPDFLCIHARP